MNSSSNPATPKKRRTTSLPVIFGALLAGFAAYYLDAGPKLMTYVMYLQEQSKVKSGLKKANDDVLKEPLPAAIELSDSEMSVNADGEPIAKPKNK